MTNTPVDLGDWVEVAGTSCVLPSEQKPLRQDEFDALFQSEVTAVDRGAEREAVFEFRPDPVTAGRIADLAARETQCCSFFEFTVVITAGRLTTHVRVPQAQVEVLDALVTRVRTSIARGSS